MEKKPYTNYARPAAPNPAAKFGKPVEKSVAANASGEAPSESVEIEKVEEVIPESVAEEKAPVKTFERVDDVAEPVNQKIVNTNMLNVRSTPESDYNNVVDQLRRDTKVNVIEEVGEFSKIGEGRYVMTKFLA